MADAKLILKSARPSKDGRSTYGKDEKMTMAYIRSAFKFTPAADKQLRTGVAKLAAAQAVRTKMKVMKKKAAMKKAPAVAEPKTMKAMKVMKKKTAMKKAPAV